MKLTPGMKSGTENNPSAGFDESDRLEIQRRLLNVKKKDHMIQRLKRYEYNNQDGGPDLTFCNMMFLYDQGNLCSL